MKRKIICLTVILVMFLLVCSGCGKDHSESGIRNSELNLETKTEEKDPVDSDTSVNEENGEIPSEENMDEEKEGKTPEKDQPFLEQITDDDPSIAYALVRMQNSNGLLPLPTEGEYTRTIRQLMDDGTEAINVLHLTTNGIWMEDANCEGHDCILEGEVTLENREERVLWNMIICLPHELAIELITREEAVSLLDR